MGKTSDAKCTSLRPLPTNPTVVICLPGDGYVGKFCAECLIANVKATLAQVFNPYIFPARVNIERGNLVLHSFQTYTASDPASHLAIITTDLKITDPDVAFNACLGLAAQISQVAPREVLLLDGFVPGEKFERNRISQLLVDAPRITFWQGKGIPPFKPTAEKGKYFLALASALKVVGTPARALICETSGADVDPEGAKLLLQQLAGHPSFPSALDFSRVDDVAREIRSELGDLVKLERDRAVKEEETRRGKNSDLSYIQ